MTEELIGITKPEVILILSTLVGVITLLWKLLTIKDKKESERLEKCEKMHDEATCEIKKLTGDFNFLKGRIEGIENLSKSVLRVIDEVNKKK